MKRRQYEILGKVIIRLVTLYVAHIKDSRIRQPLTKALETVYNETLAFEEVREGGII